jgi:hypothetical protein
MAAAIMIERDSDAAAQHQATPPDPVREFTASGVVMGSLFPDIDRLVSRNEYPCLSNRFGSVEEYRNAGPLTAGLIPKSASLRGSNFLLLRG